MAESGAVDLDAFLHSLIKLHKLQDIGCHWEVLCDKCKQQGIVGCRYKCLKCDNYDLCSDCFEEREKSMNHETNHPMLIIHSPGEIERDVLTSLNSLDLGTLQKQLHGIPEASHQCACSVCKEEPIKGLAFTCADCRSYYMCWKCYNKGTLTQNHKKHHACIVHVFPLKYEFSKDHLTMGEKIGAGCFGEVYVGALEGTEVAIKVADLATFGICSDDKKESELQFKLLKNEIQIYMEFFSNYIVRYYGYVHEADKLYMILEYMHGGNLEMKLYGGKYEEVSLHRRFSYCCNLIQGLFRMHRKAIVHKDLKPDNLFITKADTLKIGDLGIAIHPDTVVPTVKVVRQCKYYPKQDMRDDHAAYDIYAFGRLLAEIMTGKRCFSLKPEDCKKELKFFPELVAACISPDARQRPPTHKIREYMRDFEKIFTEVKKQLIVEYNSQNLETRNLVFSVSYDGFVEQFGAFSSEDCDDDPYQIGQLSTVDSGLGSSNGSGQEGLLTLLRQLQIRVDDLDRREAALTERENTQNKSKSCTIC